MLRANQLDVDRACVLVVDVQEKLLPLIRGKDRVVTACRKLLDGCGVFELPVLATEQYPNGIGRTDESIRRSLDKGGAKIIEKTAFSVWAESDARRAILEVDRPQIILAGIETHVCVQQTALDLVSRDYDVYVCGDATGSRGRSDHELALARMRQEGAWVTTVESVLFELCNRCDAPRFKAMLEVIKEFPPGGE